MLKTTSIIISFLFSVSLTAQDLIRYTTKDGLPSNHIYDVAQDSDGFMWFATNRGVVKFDGISFKTFTVKDGLPNNDTWKIEADFQGRIWYFSKSNYQGYIQNDSVYKFIVPDSLVISPNYISKSKDRIWMYNNKMSFLSIQNNTFKKVIYGEVRGLGNFIRKHLGLTKQEWPGYFPIINPELKHYIIITKNKLFVLDINFNILYQLKHGLLDASINYTKYGSMPNQTFYLTTEKGILFINHKSKSSKYFTYKELIGQKKVKTRFCKVLLNEIQLSVPGYLLRFNYSFELIEKNSFSNSIPNHKSYKDIDGNIWLIEIGKGITFQPNTQLQTKYFLRGRNVQKIGQFNQSLMVGISNDGFYEFVYQKNNFIKKIAQNPSTIYQIKYNRESQQGFLVSSEFTLEYKNNTFSQLRFNKHNEYSSSFYNFKGFSQF